MSVHEGAVDDIVVQMTRGATLIMERGNSEDGVGYEVSKDGAVLAVGGLRKRKRLLCPTGNLRVRFLREAPGGVGIVVVGEVGVTLAVGAEEVLTWSE